MLMKRWASTSDRQGERVERKEGEREKETCRETRRERGGREREKGEGGIERDRKREERERERGDRQLERQTSIIQHLSQGKEMEPRTDLVWAV